MNDHPSEQPNNEWTRLRAVDHRDRPDASTATALCDLAALAAQACAVPFAAITFVDDTHERSAATYGLPAFATSRELSLSEGVITRRTHIALDPQEDPRFAASPLVAGYPHVRFFAAAPLLTSDGDAIGAITVFDSTPRPFTADQQRALIALARQVVLCLDAHDARAALAAAAAERRASEEALRASEEFKTRMIEGSLDCIKVLDLDGRLLSMNAGGMQVLDICDFAPLCNALWPDLWPEESRQMVRDAVEAAKRQRVGRFVGFCPTMNGTPKWWDVAVTALLDRDGRPDRLLAVSRDITDRKRNENVLEAITQGTASTVGEAFFTALAQHLATALQVRYVFLAECLEGHMARSRAFWNGGGLGENFEYDLTGTPCLRVVGGDVCCYPRDLQQLFPEDTGLVPMEAESYIGVPLLSSAGAVIGHLVIIDDKPLDGDPFRVSVLKAFAGRAGAELERQQADERLRHALSEVERLQRQLQAENTYLQEEIRGEHNFHEMVGNSAALIEALRKVERVAMTDSTVLILGETGCGKELFARAIHSRSKRHQRPLVKVNCGAIAPGLVESELFGHAKGAFTGAIDKRVGRFEVANGGTIFLDEVGELPLDAQVKLLRVLQEHEFEPVGSSRTVRVDVRVIAATNRNLEDAVREGRFRADLLYRLNVIPIEVPPLRERQHDIDLLLAFFCASMARKLGKRIDGFATRSLQRLREYSWPGNVRELQNLVERAAILAQGPVLDLDAFEDRALAAPAALQPTTHISPVTVVRPGQLHDVQRQHILDVLKTTNGVIEGERGAATILGLHPNTLRSRMKKLGISAASLRVSP